VDTDPGQRNRGSPICWIVERRVGSRHEATGADLGRGLRGA
jgi:hypothetical protein